MPEVTLARPETKYPKWLPVAPVLISIFVVSITIFLVNARSDNFYGDLVPVYGSVQSMVAGNNPYSVTDVGTALEKHGVEANRYPDGDPQAYWSTHALLYPPLTFCLMSPLAVVNYPTASRAYFWISALTMIASCYLLIRLSPPFARTVTVLGVSAVLMTGSILLRLGQVSSLVIPLVIIASILFIRHKYPVVAGIFFFIAAALKPQLVLPLLVYFCFSHFSRKYALGALAAFVIAAALAGGAFARRPATSHWVSDVSAQVHRAYPLGEPPIDMGQIDLKPMAAMVNGNPVFYQSFDLVVFAGIIAILAFGFIRTQESEDRDWIFVAALTYFTLLLTYHRFTDLRIQLLAFPALGILWRRSTKMAAVLTILSLLCMFSTARFLVIWAVAHYGESVGHHLIFRLFIERQQAVAVLLAAIIWAIACATVWRSSNPEAEVSQPQL